ncbi:MAG: TlpA family protein disulfide reductase [Candidatus Yanofskybacteria bacterium]|nr:TlpA family protein disulfide reductase [Candidatus Yanofskybacteria bacterium]
MKKPHISIIIVAVLVIGWLLTSRNGQGPAENINAPSGQDIRLEKAPNFSLKDYSGETVNFADFAGKPLVINSWAAWCPFCRQELPDFAAAQKEFGNQVVIIAIDRQESLAVAKGFTDEQGTTDELIFLLDPKDSFYKSIGGFSMPETIFVNKDGNIADHKRGPMDFNEIRQKIQKIL